MKTLIILILLTGAFLAGYYVGHLPDSPDIFEWARSTYKQASDAGQQLSSIVNGSPGNALDTVAPEKVTICVDGKTYVIGSREYDSQQMR